MGPLRFLGYLGVFAATSGILVSGAAAALAANEPAKPAVQAAAAEDDPASLVETFAYPNADQIEATKFIKLKRGDGQLLLVDCVAGHDFIEVRARNRDAYCFEVRKPGAWVTLELDNAFLVFSDSDHTTVANYTVDGVSDSATIPPGGAQGIGEGEVPGTRAVLLELRAS